MNLRAFAVAMHVSVTAVLIVGLAIIGAGETALGLLVLALGLITLAHIERAVRGVPPELEQRLAFYQSSIDIMVRKMAEDSEKVER